MSEEQPEEAAPEAEDEENEPCVLLLVDPDEQERVKVEDLEPELSMRVTPIDPSDLVTQLEGFDRAGAVVVAWDLGGRSGLELVESLIRDPRAAEARFALASEAPTRGMVEAALRAGASGFLFRPYEAEALVRFVGAAADGGSEAEAEA